MAEEHETTRGTILEMLRERFPELEDRGILRAAREEPMFPRPKGQSALTASQLVRGDRDSAYGDPYEETKRICAIYNAIRGHVHRETGFKLTPIEFEYIMISLKLSRQQNSHKRDNFDDLCGYVDLACHVAERTIEEIQQESQRLHKALHPARTCVIESADRPD